MDQNRSSQTTKPDYVPGVTASGRFAFISGQLGLEEDGSVIDDPAMQIALAFTNLGDS